MNTTLGQYGRLLLARWRWLAWGVILALAATTAFLILQPPLYRTHATVYVRTPGDVSRVQDGGAEYAQAHAATYAALAKSTSLSSRVIADLGLDLAPERLSNRVRAKQRAGTALIDISVSAPSAAEAERTATVLLSEYATTVRSMESVPGSVVPRAELVVVDSPGRPVRTVAWGTPLPLVLLGSAVIGLFLGALAAVVRSMIKHPANDQDEVAAAARPVAPEAVTAPGVALEVVSAPSVPVQSAANISPSPPPPAVGRHRRVRSRPEPVGQEGEK
jgi:capsular polysaccharide biosynthesis protein